MVGVKMHLFSTNADWWLLLCTKDRLTSKSDDNSVYSTPTTSIAGPQNIFICSADYICPELLD
jgi:hypothetical protein